MKQTYTFLSDSLITSCPLPKNMIHHQRRTKNMMSVSAYKIEPLSAFLKQYKKHMEYEDLERLIDSIGRQFEGLERENKGVIGFNLDDITVFHERIRQKSKSRDSDTASDSDTDDSDNTDDTDAATDDTVKTIKHFAITNEDKIVDIDEENNLTITTPFASHDSTAKNKAFHSPEFTEFISKKTLPYAIHFKSGYYSFGLLCKYCFLSRMATTAAHTEHATHAEHEFEPITNTKIYWFLKRVLQENPTERRYICV